MSTATPSTRGLEAQPSLPPPRSVSVIVPAFDCVEVVGEQLAALERQDYTGAWELLLVDNGSRDGTRERLIEWAERRPHARFLEAHERQGAGHARNVGSAAAGGELLLYCDADDVVDRAWVRAMSDGARFGTLLAGVDVEFDGRRLGPRPTTLTPAAPATHVAGTFLPFARGGNLGIYARTLEAAGGWNEHWPRGQDVELSWRVQLGGHALLTVPDALVAYRRPDGYRAMLRHQYAFGRQAPRLYQAFQGQGAVTPSPGTAAGDLLRVLARVPNVVRSEDRRSAWILNAAGVVGRAVGTLAVRTRRTPRTTENPSRGTRRTRADHSSHVEDGSNGTTG